MSARSDSASGRQPCGMGHRSVSMGTPRYLRMLGILKHPTNTGPCDSLSCGQASKPSLELPQEAGGTQLWRGYLSRE